MGATESATSTIRDVEGLTPVHWAAVVLAAATGLIHLYLGVVQGLVPFVVAGIGFFVGLAVFFSAYWRRWLYPVAALYAAVQVVLWVAGGTQQFQVGVVDKAIQVLFIAATLYLYWADAG